MRPHLVYYFLLLILPLLSKGQPLLRMNVPFTINGRIMEWPLAGGLNAPQFSAADVNHGKWK